jgi:polar amino acid transport system substrate-binding protein
VFQEEGDLLSGVITEVLRLIFEDLDITVDAKRRGNWKRCQYYARIGVVDIIMAAVFNEKRSQYAVFTKTPIVSAPVSIFVLKGREFKFDKWDDLIGKRAGIRLGTSISQKVDTFFKDNIKDVIEVSTD